MKWSTLYVCEYLDPDHRQITSQLTGRDEDQCSFVCIKGTDKQAVWAGYASRELLDSFADTLRDIFTAHPSMPIDEAVSKLLVLGYDAWSITDWDSTSLTLEGCARRHVITLRKIDINAQFGPLMEAVI